MEIYPDRERDKARPNHRPTRGGNTEGRGVTPPSRSEELGSGLRSVHADYAVSQIARCARSLEVVLDMTDAIGVWRKR